MKPISMPSFPKRPPGRPWTPAGSAAMEPASRHLRWAAGITSRLARRSRWPGLHFEAMTLAHPLRLRILRLQTAIQYLRSETRLLHPPAAEPKPLGSGEAVPTVSASLQSAAPRQTIVERNQFLVSFIGEIKRHSARPAAPAAGIGGKRIAGFVEKFAAPRISGLMPGGTGLTTPLVLSPRHRGAAHGTNDFEESDSTAAIRPEGVLRRHRRVETRPFAFPREAAPHILPTLSTDVPATVHLSPARRSAAQRFDGQEEAGTRRSASPQAPQVNLTQITDAVLQQLDRRLIAARERMGRI
jgi:hypothetical protein